ncbi:hypothetical protein MNBD_CHLOROFLEXI01-4845 [hydrothermal vent metagenome]|uniref:Response regulatory domain-containing protein n=1 Tax=hydrothermal vent metagenome TaxID=652676 RepID=A0A3B0W8S0_9ZZZZ
MLDKLEPAISPSALTRICIVDDNQIAREVIAEQLSIEPYQIEMAASGVELLDRFDTLGGFRKIIEGNHTIFRNPLEAFSD